MNTTKPSKTNKRFIAMFSILIIGTLSLFSACSEKKGIPVVQNSKELENLCIEIAEKYNQPAVAAALVQGDDIIAAVTGRIVYGQAQEVTMNSRFHIGSITKSMTAVLVALLVKQGKLDYDMTLEQALPDMPMKDAYKKVTIADLLNNKAGIIAYQLIAQEDPVIVERLMEKIPADYPDPTEQRRETTKLALSLEPIAEPGTKVIYSNVGWPIVGYILEKTAGESYETLLQKHIFDPLNMTTARVGGWPASDSEPHQPRGHYPGRDRSTPPVPQALDDEYVLPAWMNPSGGVHCSIRDFAVYVQEHMLGLQGKGKILEQADYKKIHSIQAIANLKEMYPHMNQDREACFGYGWGIDKQNNGNISIAAGSGGTFFAQAIVYPAANMAFVGFTNCGNGGIALKELYSRATGSD
jgi:CubicO group peptidase (beta-lactamase class C family)